MSALTAATDGAAQTELGDVMDLAKVVFPLSVATLILVSLAGVTVQVIIDLRRELARLSDENTRLNNECVRICTAVNVEVVTNTELLARCAWLEKRIAFWEGATGGIDPKSRYAN